MCSSVIHAYVGQRSGPIRWGSNRWAALVDVYYMLLRDQPYQDLGPDWLSHRNDQARTRQLVAQLERLGHTVVIDPAA